MNIMNIYNHSIVSVNLDSYPRYLFVHTPNLPYSIVSLWLRAGSRFDPPSKEGLAHFTEHLQMKRTKKFPEKINRLKHLEQRGIRFNSLTTKDPLYYFCVQEPQETITALDLLLEGFMNSLISEKDIEKEKNVIFDEIRRRGGSSSSPIWRLANKGLWAGTGFEHEILGREKAIKKFSLKDIKEFQNNYYSLGNLSIIILSPIKNDLKQAESKLSKLGETKKINIDKEENIKPLKYILRKNSGKNVHIAISFLTKTYKTDEDIITLRFIQNYLAGNWTSRLVQKLRVERNFTYWVNGFIKNYSDAGFIRFTFSMQKQHLYKALVIFSEEILRLKAKQLSKNQIEQYTKILRTHLISATFSIEGILWYYGWNFIVYERVPQLLQNHLEAHNNILSKSILAASTEQLDFPY